MHRQGHAPALGDLRAEELAHLGAVRGGGAADGREPGVLVILGGEGGGGGIPRAAVLPILAEAAVQGEPGGIQVRAGQPLHLHPAGRGVMVGQAVGEDHPGGALRRQLLPADGHPGMAQAAGVAKGVFAGGALVAVRQNPRIHVVRFLIPEAQPEAVQHLDGVHP